MLDSPTAVGCSVMVGETTHISFSSFSCLIAVTSVVKKVAATWWYHLSRIALLVEGITGSVVTVGLSGMADSSPGGCLAQVSTTGSSSFHLWWQWRIDHVHNSLDSTC